MMLYVWIWFHVLSEEQEGFCAMFVPTIVRMWYFCSVPVYLCVIILNHFPALLITSSQTSRLQRKFLHSLQQSLTHCYKHMSSGFLFTPSYRVE